MNIKMPRLINDHTIFLGLIVGIFVVSASYRVEKSNLWKEIIASNNIVVGVISEVHKNNGIISDDANEAIEFSFKHVRFLNKEMFDIGDKYCLLLNKSCFGGNRLENKYQVMKIVKDSVLINADLLAGLDDQDLLKNLTVSGSFGTFNRVGYKTSLKAFMNLISKVRSWNKNKCSSVGELSGKLELSVYKSMKKSFDRK